jgi:hypothetical protein
MTELRKQTIPKIGCRKPREDLRCLRAKQSNILALLGSALQKDCSTICAASAAVVVGEQGLLVQLLLGDCNIIAVALAACLDTILAIRLLFATANMANKESGKGTLYL